MRLRDEWVEDDRSVLWFAFHGAPPAIEPGTDVYIGTPLDDECDESYTHWVPMPHVYAAGSHPVEDETREGEIYMRATSGDVAGDDVLWLLEELAAARKGVARRPHAPSTQVPGMTAAERASVFMGLQSVERELVELVRLYFDELRAPVQNAIPAAERLAMAPDAIARMRQHRERILSLFGPGTDRFRVRVRHALEGCPFLEGEE